MILPTVGATVTANASRRYFIGFHCCSCGREAVMDYFIEEHAQARYHRLSSPRTRAYRSAQAKETAYNGLDALDETLYTEINEKHHYAFIQDKVDCPYCGTTQVWSNYPAPWNRTATFPWILGMLLPAALAVLLFLGKIVPGAAGVVLGVLCLAAVCAVAALPLWVKHRRSTAQKAIDSAQFEPPVYYDERNIDQMVARTVRMRHEAPDAYVPFEYK